MRRCGFASLASALAISVVSLLLTWGSAAAEPVVYVVKPGDTLSAIARAHGTTADSLAQLNGLTNPNLIKVGQTLTLSAEGGAVVAPVSTEPAPLELASAAAAEPILAIQGHLSPNESDLLSRIQQQRARHGLGGLIYDSTLDKVARERSNDMASRGYFAHTSPEGETASGLVRASGGRYGHVGEILARNNYPADQSAAVAMDGFMNSPVHRDNVLWPNYSRVGVAESVSAKGVRYFTVVLAQQ